ncbi:MAG: glycosyltransferase family 4 protein [Gemmatimonadota bacterium]
MRVLLLSPESPPRGVLRSLVTLGVEPVVPRASGETETDGQIQFVRIASRGDAHDPMDLRWSRKPLRTLVRDTGPALIHIVADPWTPTAEAGAAAARDLKLPYVLVGTSSVGGAKGITAGWQSRRIRDDAAALGGVVRSALDHLAEGATGKPTAVIPTGGLTIPASQPNRPDDGPITLGVVGRVMRERGLDLLLDALSETYGDWRVRIIGAGSAQETLEAQAQRLGLSSRLEWLGALPREALGEFWGTIDALVAPSRSTATWVEPTGGVVLEAMAHGVAPIVSRCGALPDVVAEAGLVVDEDDQPALARALQGLVGERARAREIGAAARQRVLECYGDGAVAERMVLWWRRALQPQ